MAIGEIASHQPHAPSTGGCTTCGAPLAEDQRYCLNCGARRGDARLDVTEWLGEPAARNDPPAPAPSAAVAGPRDVTPVAALGGLALLAVVLLAGVLIGRGNDRARGAPQVVQLGGQAAGSGTGATAGVAATSFKGDWPQGKKGYTVAIGQLPKKSTQPAQVQSAKADATTKGAPQVGALDSDRYKSLPGGNYVVFSGVYAKKDQAAAALGKLKGKFPQARVVRVAGDSGGGPGGKGDASYAGKQEAKLSRSQLQDLNNLSGDDYVKRSKKLPTTTVLPGKPPPKDNKRPGGGTNAVTIK